MVKIRLSRAGARKRPFYRVVAVDERTPRDGRAARGPRHLRPEDESRAARDLAPDAIEAWVTKGAQLSPTVKSLLRRAKRRAAPRRSA